MTDALEVLRLSAKHRVDLSLSNLEKNYPNVDISSHILRDPINLSREANPNSHLLS